MITYYIQYQRKLMFSGDIELNTGHTPVLYFCNSVQNNSPTKLSLNVVLEAKVKMLSVNLKYLHHYKIFQMLITESPPALITLSFCFLT